MVFPVLLFTTAGFLAVIVSLAACRANASRITGAALLLSGVGGLFVYSYGFAHQIASVPLAVLRSVLSVCYMFLGRNDFSAVSGTALFSGTPGIFLFWAVHFLAMYATAGAIIYTVGAGVLRWLRLRLVWRGELALIYGVNGDSVAFGKQLAAKKGLTVVFVDESPDASQIHAITSVGSVLCSDKNAVSPDERFLRGIGMRKGKRNMTVYALHKDETKNLAYALAMMSALEKVGIEPRQTALVILGIEERAGHSVQAFEDRYGFGGVTVFDESVLAARLLVQKYPPCDAVEFDETGRAKENFEALVVGFGRTGQAVLRHLVMHGQFEGSQFRLAVFAPNCEAVSGCLAGCSGTLEEDYRISFYPHDARSKEMYRYLSRQSKSLKYVVVCTGSSRVDREVAGELRRHLMRLGSAANVYQCSRQGVVYQKDPARPPLTHSFYTTEILCTDRMDQMAIALNQIYCAGNGLSPRENWMRCDYFSRMSSRASADFIPAMLRAAGKTAEQAMGGEWELSEEMLENLGRTEHLRWCAFHHIMGFEGMDAETYRQRCMQYLEEKKRTGSSRLRIGKDLERQRHACLIPWEKLDALSAAENAVTGGNVDYKAMDKNNVLAVPEVLRAGGAGKAWEKGAITP